MKQDFPYGIYNLQAFISQFIFNYVKFQKINFISLYFFIQTPKFWHPIPCQKNLKEREREGRCNKYNFGRGKSVEKIVKV